MLIVSELSRLGREQLELGYAVKQFSQAGVKIVSYLDDREVLLDTPTDKFLMSAISFAAEIEREKARQRTYDSMSRKARAGHVTGGRVFGYDNVEILATDGVRSHVERRINEAEAAVVRRIFDSSIAGSGYTRIAKLLNAERAPSPRPQQGRPAGWAPSSVKEILDRTLYRGEVLWNRTQKRNRWGQQDQTARPVHEWLRIADEKLRIVPDDVWNAAHSRRAGIREHLKEVTGGRPGTRPRDAESRYLLPNFARCTVCGGSLGVVSRCHGRDRAFFYGCTAYHKRGTAVCRNGLVMRLELVDEAVLRALGGDVLRPGIVMAVLDGVLDAMARPVPDAQDSLQPELEQVDREISRLTEAIAAGGELASLVSTLKTRHARREELARAVAARAAVRVTRFDRNEIQVMVRKHVNRWRGLLTKHTADGRQLLREVLAGPLRFTPDGRTYRFEGEAAIGRLFEGVAGLPTFVASQGTPSWNQILGWLRDMAKLRESGVVAA